MRIARKKNIISNVALGSDSSIGFVIGESGKRVHILDIKDGEIDVFDMCKGIASAVRWSGQCRIPFTVAQHSLLVYDLILNECWDTPVTDKRLAALKGLTHDFTESYLGDLCSPIKAEVSKYKDIERYVEGKIEEAFGMKESLTREERDLVKRADQLSMLLEGYLIMNDKAFREDCLGDIQSNYREIGGDSLIKRYENRLIVEQPQWVEGMLLKTLYNAVRNAKVRTRLYDNINCSRFEDPEDVQIYIDGEFRYNVFRSKDMFSVKDNVTKITKKLRAEVFNNMISLDGFEYLAGE